jgi:RNA-binding protein
MDSPSLTGSQRAHLRGLGQTLEASLKIGREGATPALLRELSQRLQSDELVKVRFVNADRDERAVLCDRLASELHCVCVGAVGRTALFYRQNPDPAARQVAL